MKKRLYRNNKQPGDSLSMSLVNVSCFASQYIESSSANLVKISQVTNRNLWNIKLNLLNESPGQVLQHLPGNIIGSSQVGFGHSFLIFLH